MSVLTQSLAPAKMRPWHERMIDLLVENPARTQSELAVLLGKTNAWVSIVVNSDMFQNRLKERMADAVDPVMVATVEDRMRMVVNRAADEFARRLDLAPGSVPTKDLVSAMKVSGGNLGMGSKAPIGLQQNLYVIPAPTMATSAREWRNVVTETVVVEAQVCNG